jgi:hypothetical protein
VLPTGYERGIIEVVPDTKSRAALGEISDGGLFELFQSRYGSPGTPRFEEARRNFIVSQARPTRTQGCPPDMQPPARCGYACLEIAGYAQSCRC